MKTIYTILIWILVSFVGMGGFITILLSKNKDLIKFITWVICSLVVVFFIVSMISNPFTISFIIAVGVAIVAVYND